MDTNILTALAGAVIGIGIGFVFRQYLAKRRIGSLETRVEKTLEKAEKTAQEKLLEAKNRAVEILEEAKKQETERQSRLAKIEELLLKREEGLEGRGKELEKKAGLLEREKEEVEKTRKELETIRVGQTAELERISALTKEKENEELFKRLETEHEETILRRIRHLETEAESTLSRRAQEIVASVLQRYSGSVVSEVTTTYVDLPSEDLKGKIIGKEGRNIKTLERLTGVDIFVDGSPDTVMI